MDNLHRRYEIRSTLGRGGFGTVYLANLLGAGGFAKPVALKMLHGEVREVDEIAQRMRDEARMLGLLQHRAIVRVDGLVLLDGHWTIVMEYVEGVDLERVVASGGLPASAAIEVISEVASALQSAFEDPAPDGAPLRVQHRDIKPGNIQVTAKGDVKVLDFGIARAEFASREAETQNMTFGTPAYMSPERFDSVDTHAGDIYSLGIVAYEIMAGKPFGRAQMHPGRYEKQVQAALAVLAEKGIPAPVRELIGTMIAYEPEPRPTARQVAQRARELMRIVEGPTLMSWAESQVPALAVGARPKADSYSGRILTESTVTAAAKPAPAPAPPTESSATFVVSEDPVPRPRAPTPRPTQAPDRVHPTAVFMGPAPEAEAAPPAPSGPTTGSRSVTGSSSRSRAGLVTLLGGTFALTAGVVVLALAGLVGGIWWMSRPHAASAPAALAQVEPPAEPAPAPIAPGTEAPEAPAEPDASQAAAAPTTPEAPTGDVDPALADASELAAPSDPEAPAEGAAPSAAATVRSTDVNLDCGPTSELEAAAAKGKLGQVQADCLKLAALGAAKQTDRKRLGLILLVNERQVCVSGGNCSRYESFQRSYFEEIDRSDAEMMYAYALHLSKKPKKTDAIDAETVLWAQRALENKSQWKSVQYVQRVEHLHELNARASYARWVRASEAHDKLVGRRRTDARTAILDWLSYSKQLGKENTSAREMCASVTGGEPVCGAEKVSEASPIVFTFVSIPIGAKVSVDGVDIGKAPLTRELSPGEHRVQMTSPDGAVQGERKFTAGPKEATRHIWRVGDNTWVTGQ